MEYQPWLEETSEGDRDPGASHAYAVAEAAAKAAGSSPTGEVSCCALIRSKCRSWLHNFSPACMSRPFERVNHTNCIPIIVVLYSLAALGPIESPGPQHAFLCL